MLIIAGIIIFLTSERTAMFLFIFFYYFIKSFAKKIVNYIFTFFMMIILIISQPNITRKYINATLFQFQIIEKYSTDINNFDNFNFSNLKYISDTHEKLIIAGFEIFKRFSFDWFRSKNI